MIVLVMILKTPHNTNTVNFMKRIVQDNVLLDILEQCYGLMIVV